MNPKEWWCNMCYSPKIKHEGSMEYKEKKFSGDFCSKECFDLWVKWKVAFIDWDYQKSINTLESNIKE